MTDENDAGAEISSEDLLASMEAGQAAAEIDTEGPKGEAEPEGQGAGAPDKETSEEPLPPLSVEEYQKRHQNITQALRDERNDKRQLKTELAQLRQQVQEFQTTQPQRFEAWQIDSQLQQYQGIDWQRWYQQDYDAADAANKQFQGLVARKQQIDAHNQQSQQQRQQQSQQQQIVELTNTLAQQEQNFRAEHPDYDDATEHLKAALRTEANNQGYFGAQADQYANMQLVQIGARVNAAGQDMAEFAYNLAVQRGYAPKKADIESIKAGEAAAKTISSAGGKTSNEGASFEETMGNLSGSAARAYWEKAKRNAYS